jgi:pyrimidine-nucleoside phosphorylase
MRAVDIIVKKRDGMQLSREEIEFFVKGFNRDEIPDYQAAAWAMAVLFNGMTDQETTDLTLAMAGSGETLDLSEVVPIAVDKHSTGGVGDKTTMVIGPLVAACGLPVGKMSGRGLGFSGGTLDKLESIPGYRTNLTQAEFRQQLKTHGVVVTGQTSDLAPADGKLYALRDVTGTVPSIPLIASSVMSKKIAAGAHAILLDVKAGRGAFMENLEDAHRLARLMVSIGTLSGRKTVALISDMNQPLGFAVGNVLEIVESIETLQGKGPQDFQEHCLVVSAHMLVLGQKAGSLNEARQMVDEALADGRGWEKFRELVKAQGGDVKYVDDPKRMQQARLVEMVKAPRSGWVSAIHAREVGETAVALGAGRERKGDPIDHAVGIKIHSKVGDHLEKGADLFTIYASDEQLLIEAKERMLAAHEWSEEKVDPLPLFYGVID